MTLDLARLPEALRDYGLRVKETSGWLTRGYDDVDFVAPLTHHTGGSGTLGLTTVNFVIEGRVGPNEPNPLKGPLSNSLEGIEADGIYTVYLIAGRRARHAGPGSPVVFAEILRNFHDGRTAYERGLADDENTHGNRRLFGREIHHPGSGPWSDATEEGMGRSSAALCDLAGWSPERHLGHKHWTRRKPDPSWPGRLPDLTRRYLEDDMSLSDDDITRIAAALAPVMQKECREELMAFGRYLFADAGNTVYADTRLGLQEGQGPPVTMRDLSAKLDALQPQTSGTGGGPGGTYKVTRVGD